MNADTSMPPLPLEEQPICEMKPAARAYWGTLFWGLVLLPFFLLAMYERNGQPLEKILYQLIQSRFIRPKKRPYRTDNFYAAVERQTNLDKEVKAIVHQENHPTKTQPRGQKSH